VIPNLTTKLQRKLSADAM